jgi:alkanesulfonate monooxygenase SsuD/methylene tetrahydromethanopterin reductase-like flavin-dependent oxidoreductase (luciferase family)
MLAATERMRRLWARTDEGLDLLPRPFTAGGPPLWLGAGGPRMLRIAGTSFDGWLPLSPNPGAYADGLRAVREAAEGAGRDPDSLATGVYLTIAVADSREAAMKELDDYIRAYYGAPADVMGRTMALHAGTLESAREWFAAYREAGARHLVIRLARPGLRDYDDTVRRLLRAAA